MDLEIKKELNSTELIVSLVGRLNTITSPELESELASQYSNITKLTIDFKDLEYISSAGLRVVLSAHKALNGNVVLKNLNDSVMEVFEMTGFSNIFTIE